MKGNYILKTSLDIAGLLHKLSQCDFTDPIEVTWKLHVEIRSISQNSLMWKWNNEISDWLKQKDAVHYNDWSPQNVHDAHKHTFLGWETQTYTNIKTGFKHTKEELKTTTRLDKGEMQYFMDQIYYYWADKKCFLTVPELSQYSKNKKKENE